MTSTPGIRETGSPSINWPTARAHEWTEQLVQWAHHDPSILAVVAIGSAVRPVDEVADLDLIVVLDGPRPRLARRPMEVDIRYLEKSAAARKLAESDDLLIWSMKFGKVLFDRGAWADLQQSFAESPRWPSWELSERRAGKAAKRAIELAALGDHDAALELRISSLTHRARAALLRARVFPASRPELPAQLRQIDEDALALELADALAERRARAA